MLFRPRPPSPTRWFMNSNKSNAVGPAQAYGIDWACGRPAPQIRPLGLTGAEKHTKHRRCLLKVVCLISMLWRRRGANQEGHEEEGVRRYHLKVEHIW